MKVGSIVQTPEGTIGVVVENGAGWARVQTRTRCDRHRQLDLTLLANSAEQALDVVKMQAASEAADEVRRGLGRLAIKEPVPVQEFLRDNGVPVPEQELDIEITVKFAFKAVPASEGSAAAVASEDGTYLSDSFVVVVDEQARIGLDDDWTNAAAKFIGISEIKFGGWDQ